MFGLHFSRLGSVNILAPINRALSFISALSNSITPQRGSAATFTRSTTATVVDQDSVVRTAKINEARFPGLRRVENLFTATSSLGSACFNNGISGFFNATQNIKLSKNGEMVGCRYIATASTAQGIFSRATPPASLVAGTYLVFLDVFIPSQPGVYDWKIQFDFGDVEVGTSATQTTFDAWVTAWAVVTISATRSFVDFNVRYNGSTTPLGYGFELYACYAQLENVTGQAVQTPGEYVSNEVLSSPWHGAGVDGVKYLTTTLAGAPLSGKFLSEPARTNLLIRSQEFDDAAWTKSTTTVSANNATAPDGGFTADLITSADEVGIYQAFAVTPGVVYTASVFFKKDTCTIYRFRDFSDDHHVVFTVATKTFSSPFDVISYGYQELSNGWFRIWMTYTAVGSTSAHNLRPNSQAGSTSYWQWGAQLEAGNRASSYIPTVASAVTRAADSLSYPVTASPTQGGFSCTLVPAEAPVTAAMFYAVGLFGATNADAIGLYTSPGTSDLYCFVRKAGLTTLNLLLGTVVAGATYKVAVSWAGTAVRVSVNGGAVVSDTASNMPASLSSFNNSIDTVWNGQLSDVKVFTQALSDNTLRQLTT